MAERIQIGPRLPHSLHRTLQELAARSGVSLNAEIETRLSRSVENDSDAGRLGEAVAMVAALAGEAASAHVPGKTAWADDPWAFGQVCVAITELLGYLRPEGPIVRPEPSPTLIEGLIAGGSTPEQARLVAEAVVDRGPSLHMVNSLTMQGHGNLLAGAREFQSRIGPKWSGRIKRRRSK